MIKRFLIAIVVLTFAVACSDECNDAVVPDTPSVFVSLLDNISGNSVFTDSIYLSNEVSINDEETNTIPFSIISDSIVQIVLENEIIANDTIFINLTNSETSAEAQVKFLYSTYFEEEECYSIYKADTITILDYESELVNDIYIIKID